MALRKAETLVNAAQSNPATLGDAARTLLAENQNCGVEPRDCHVRVASRKEGTGSAVSVAQNEFSLNSAMSSDKPFHVYANQTQTQVKAGNPALLLVENSVSCVEVTTVHEGESSAAPVPNPEKCSHEAIVARSNMRPGRMQKLKVAANSGQNQGFEFLQECWEDPALQIVIKKLLAKFPQWGIAIVDGVLVDWEK
ncbi:hypothetical protein [Nostoc sp. JL31]|uniref:hypothetical protein n=1 Tax=Nostoc sp. JL31 TaxID=2815395 RepID=UPI0025D09649|nr:hypothetical protein [Nostoc sp. JL31]